MSEKTCNVTTTLLMRIGQTSKIEECYDTKTLQFSCAANWFDYAMKKGNKTTGDIFECVFAHLPKGDPRINGVTDFRGKPMGSHLLIAENKTDGSALLRLIPTILTPATCFFTFNVEQIFQEMNQTTPFTSWFAFDLDRYRNSMEYRAEDSSYLFIKDPFAFFEDLKEAIPQAVAAQKDILTSKRFYEEFDPSKPLLFRNVDYNMYTETSPFYDYRENREELFWKLPEYAWQSELRIAIPNINFSQDYFPEEYDYKKNILNIHLPHFQEYSLVFSAKEAHSLYFGMPNPETRCGDFAILSMSYKDIEYRAKQGNPIILQ